jgi:hypothetical protein
MACRDRASATLRTFIWTWVLLNVATDAGVFSIGRLAGVGGLGEIEDDLAGPLLCERLEGLRSAAARARPGAASVRAARQFRLDVGARLDDVERSLGVAALRAPPASSPELDVLQSDELHVKPQPSRCPMPCLGGDGSRREE